MRITRLVADAVLATMLAGCGAQPAGTPASGISGRVFLGPQCPVQSAGHPCPDAPAAGVTVTVSRPVSGAPDRPGDVVARTRTTRVGSFRLALTPGTYVVTADAGMSCAREEALVTRGRYTSVEVSCDIGIR